MINNIPKEYEEAIDKDEAIEIDGFTLYPVQVSKWRTFERVKSSIMIRMASLPAKYAVMSYLNAMYTLDFDAIAEGSKPPMFIATLSAMIALSLRVPAPDFVRNMDIKVDTKNQRSLKWIEYRIDEKTWKLTPKVFDAIRPIMAEQNGLELPDEAENIDLVQAEQDIASARRLDIEPDFYTMLVSVAANQQKRPKELMDWTIKELYGIRSAIERDKLFMLYRSAELSGFVKFKGKTPCPSWCYDGKQGDSLISMKSFMSEGPGSVAAKK